MRSPEYLAAREREWQDFARREQFPAHEHGPTDTQPRLSTRNYFRQCWDAGYDANQDKHDREAVTQ